MTTLDQTITYYCYDWCGSYVSEDHSTATLHLVRVPADGTAASEVMALPIDRPDTQDIGQESDESVRLIDARGFGKNLAIGIVTGWNTHAVRVLRLDTTGL